MYRLKIKIPVYGSYLIVVVSMKPENARRYISSYVAHADKLRRGVWPIISSYPCIPVSLVSVDVSRIPGAWYASSSMLEDISLRIKQQLSHIYISGRDPRDNSKPQIIFNMGYWGVTDTPLCYSDVSRIAVLINKEP